MCTQPKCNYSDFNPDWTDHNQLDVIWYLNTISEIDRNIIISDPDMKQVNKFPQARF